MTVDRRLAHLKKANEIRVLRAQVKRDLAAGGIEAWPLIAEPPAELATMKVYDVLLAQDKWGVVKTRRFLRAHGVSEVKTLAGLSARQRAEVVDCLRVSADAARKGWAQ